MCLGQSEFQLFNLVVMIRKRMVNDKGDGNDGGDGGRETTSARAWVERLHWLTSVPHPS